MPLRILIAEDDATSRAFLAKMLQDCGSCDLVSDGIQAVEAVIQAYEGEGHPYDLLCLDIMMPRVDGITALRAIRAAEKKLKIPQEKALKVIILSALNEEQAQATGLDAEYNAYLEKPIDMAEFDRIIRRLCPAEKETGSL